MVENTKVPTVDYLQQGNYSSGITHPLPPGGTLVTKSPQCTTPGSGSGGTPVLKSDAFTAAPLALRAHVGRLDTIADQARYRA